MSQNESTTFLVTDAKNLTLIDATRENSPWWVRPYSIYRSTMILGGHKEDPKSQNTAVGPEGIYQDTNPRMRKG